MINVYVNRNKEGLIEEFRVQGHAEFSEAGTDIVCSAVSAVCYTALGGLVNLVDSKIGFSTKDGKLRCRLPVHLDDKQRQNAGVILETMTIGLLQIEKNYCEYVRIVQEEV